MSTFTVHDVTRDGAPSDRTLLTTEFYDIATQSAVGLATWRFGEDTQSVQLLDLGVDLFVICKDGRPFSYVQLQQAEIRRWKVRLEGER